VKDLTLIFRRLCDLYIVSGERSAHSCQNKPQNGFCGAKFYKIHGGIYYEYGSKNKHNGVKR